MQHDGVVKVTKSIPGRPVFGLEQPLSPFYSPNPTIFHATIQKGGCRFLNCCCNNVARSRSGAAARNESHFMLHTQLPDPDGDALDSEALRPWSKDVVIYDGECRFCRGQVERLKRFDSGGKLTFISLHDSRLRKRYPDLSHDELMRQMYVVTPEGKKFGGAAAVRYLTRKLPSLYWLMPLMHIPFTLPVWQWGYNQVAKRRYKLAGKVCDGDTCSIHFKN